MSTSTSTSNFSRLQELLPELFQANQLQGKAYLRSQLTPEITALLPMEFVQESLLVEQEQITPIPGMPEHFIGLINSRDRIFGLIDLPLLLGVTKEINSFRRIYHTVVIRTNDFSNSSSEQLLGLVWENIQGVTRLDGEQMQPPSGEIASPLQPHISGCLTSQEQELPVLNLENIVKQIIEA